MNPHTLFHPSLWTRPSIFFEKVSPKETQDEWPQGSVRHRDMLSPSREVPETIWFIQPPLPFCRASLVVSAGKESACNAGDPGLILVFRKMPWRRDRLPTPVFLGFPDGSAGKESPCNVGDLGSIPGLGRSPGGGNSYPLQYSGLENSMDCIVHGVTKSWTWLSDFSLHFTSILKTHVLPIRPFFD